MSIVSLISLESKLVLIDVGKVCNNSEVYIDHVLLYVGCSEIKIVTILFVILVSDQKFYYNFICMLLLFLWKCIPLSSK